MSLCVCVCVAKATEAEAAAVDASADADAEAAAAAYKAEAMEASARVVQIKKATKFAEGGNVDPAHLAQNEDQNHDEVD